MYTTNNFRHFTKTSTWTLLIYPLLTIANKKFLFHVHYNKVELYVIILCLTYSYWMVFCNLVNTYIDTALKVSKYRVFSGSYFPVF